MVLLFIAIGGFIGLFSYLTIIKMPLGKRLAISLLPFIICIFNFVAYVPENHVGVLFSPFSGVKEETLRDGLQGKGFFDRVYTISTEIQTKRVEGIVGQTKDAQYITMDLDIKYNVDSSNAFEVFKMFRTLENVDKNLIVPIAQRSVETITTQYDIIQILGEKRNEVYDGIERELKERLKKYRINLHDVILLDTDAGDAIEKAIEEEAVAKKQVETAEQLREKARIEAEQRVIEAEGEAKVKLIQAQSDAEAYRIMGEQINDGVLRKLWIEKWNGELPQVVLGDDVGVIINLDDKGEDRDKADKSVNNSGGQSNKAEKSEDKKEETNNNENKKEEVKSEENKDNNETGAGQSEESSIDVGKIMQKVNEWFENNLQ